MTIRFVIHKFCCRLQSSDDLRIWKELPTNNEKLIFFDTDNYDVTEAWTEWNTPSNID